MTKEKNNDFIIVYHQNHCRETYDEDYGYGTEEVSEEEWRIELHLNEFIARYWFEYMAQTLPKGVLELIKIDLDEDFQRIPGTRKLLEKREIKETDNLNRPQIIPYEFYEKYVIKKQK